MLAHRYYPLNRADYGLGGAARPTQWAPPRRLEMVEMVGTVGLVKTWWPAVEAEYFFQFIDDDM